MAENQSVLYSVQEMKSRGRIPAGEASYAVITTLTSEPKHFIAYGVELKPQSRRTWIVRGAFGQELDDFRSLLQTCRISVIDAFKESGKYFDQRQLSAKAALMSGHQTSGDPPPTDPPGFAAVHIAEEFFALGGMEQGALEASSKTG